MRVFLYSFAVRYFGNIPFFLTALQHVEPRRERRVIVRELLIALLALVLFLFIGQPVLKLLHISEPSLTIAVRMLMTGISQFLQQALLDSVKLILTPPKIVMLDT